MSLGSALNTAVAALNAQSAAISSVSENIANASTTAYKTSGVAFKDLVTGDTSSTQNTSGSVTYSTYQNLSSQGAISASDTSTNIALSGNGFFVVEQDPSETSPDYMYSRNGSFSADANGYLVNSEGYYLMGWPTDADGNVTATNSSSLSSLEPVDTQALTGLAKATDSMSIAANLPANAAVGDSYTTSTEVYDSLGVSSSVTETWTKTAANTWTLALSNPVLSSDNTTTSGTISPASIDITFNSDGTLGSTNPDPATISITGYTTGAADSSIALDLGTAGSTDGLTQYASTDTTVGIGSFTTSQNGVQYGSLKSITISDDGIVTANFDNGLTQDIYKIPVATFSNANGLTQVSGTVYNDNAAAGNYVLNAAGDGAAGTISASALEGSTTDTSSEFSRMIIAQQAYSAAAQVVSTDKDMFSTLMTAVR